VTRHHPYGEACSPGSGDCPFTRRRSTITTAKDKEALMSATQYDPQRSEDVSGWALGAIAFAATIMTLAGVFQALAGLVAIFNDDFYVVARNYTFDLDVSAWGWIHLILGLAVFATGLGLFARATWAGVVAIMICMLSALANFFFIPYYPIWSLLVIGLNFWVIWALTRPGAVRT
jgi:hypothetical protein